MTPFHLKRLEIMMELGNPNKAEEVLHPAAVRGPDGHLSLFPRLAAQGNYSRIGAS